VSGLAAGAAAGGTAVSVDALPGPRGLPFLGVMLQVDRPHFHAQVEGWLRRFGPAIAFRLAGQRIVVFGDAEALGAVLRDRPEGFRRTPRLAAISRELGLAGGVFGAEGEAWKRQRRMVMAGFDPRHLRAYFPKLVVTARRLERRWQGAARVGTPIDLQGDLMRFTVDAISGLAFGADTNTLESDADVIQRHLDRIFPTIFRRLLAPVPTWRWFRTKADREVDASVAAVDAAIRGFIAAARERLAADPARREKPANLLEAMLVAADTEGSGIGEQEIAGNVMTMLLAGEDTTAHTLAWAVDFLHRHPDALARARAEVDARCGPIDAWTVERFASLPWLEACTSETMRLKPVAPALTLQALRETVVAGVRVPKGTIVWGALRGPSLEARHFDAPERFDPERWLDGGTPAPGSLSANRVAMPFGAGPRVCPGRQLALLEMKIALAVLVGSFDIASLRTASGGPPDERLSFTMAPEPMAMVLAERAAA
jgi:cytochrome P450